MVYKTKFLKQRVDTDYSQLADGAHTWDLSDEALAAIWITVKGDLHAADMCIDDFMASITGLDVWFGSWNAVHYAHGIKCLLMNCKLKQHWPYLVNSTQTATNKVGVSFPILFGAPYLKEDMALPRSVSNRKRLTLTLDVASSAIDNLLIDISEVILPGAAPTSCIKQEEIAVPGTIAGERDINLQTNWDLLKLLMYSTTVPHGTAFLSTIERATLEIDDFPFGYKSVPWEHLHVELMDELEGSGPVEDHYHLYDTVTHTSFPFDLERWIAHYGQLDFFYEKDIKWRAPLAGASTAKLKLVTGDTQDMYLVFAYYVPVAKI